MVNHGFILMVHHTSQRNNMDTIPQPMSSGATDHPEVPQSGQSLPAGLSDTPPDQTLPAGLSDTPPQTSKDTTGLSSVGLTPEQNVVVGVGKGAGQTISTLGKVANASLRYLNPAGSGDDVNPVSNKISQGLKILDENTEPENAGQKAGVLLEGVGEFLLGDEALKGLSIAERLGLAQKVA